MTAHDHSTYVDGCYRCELGRDEVERICPAYDSWGDLTCDLERGHEGPHNDCGAPWASPHEQDRWTA